MTPKQRELARHALGLPNEQKCSYRNRFVISSSTPTYEEWVAMVRDGEACIAHWHAVGVNHGRVLFMMTYAGACTALDEGERLDPEDFSEDVDQKAQKTVS